MELSTEGTFDCFFFEKNLQGDIVAVYDDTGYRIGKYVYDAWGRCTVVCNSTGFDKTILESYNPFRYRGYFYDIETQMYYLQSRYYSPDMGRFLNGDGYVSTGQGLLGNNMFAYCSNNPVNEVDYLGNKPGDLFDTPDEAAIDFARYYNAKSINKKQEYGSAIYKTLAIDITMQPAPWYLSILGIKEVPKFTISVKYSYTFTFVGINGKSVLPNIFTNFPIVSTIHTHGNYDPKYKNEDFSTGFMKDIGWSNFFRMDSYLVTPGGFLKKYTYKNRNNSNKGISVIPANDIPWDPNSPIHAEWR